MPKGIAGLGGDACLVGKQIHMAGAAFDKQGSFVDAELEQRTSAFMAGFAAFVANRRGTSNELTGRVG